MPSDTAAVLDHLPTPAPSDTICIRTGQHLRRLRTRRGYSLDRLAKVSGVSRAMLGQIETGKSSPTLSILAKIAAALEVTCGSLIIEAEEPTTVLLTRAGSKTLSSSDGKFETRALFPYDGDRTVEFYELRLAPHHSERADAHRHGTVENLVVTEGTVEVIVGKQPYILGEGDALLFEADVPHVYRNMTGSPATVYLVSTCKDVIHQI
ncbi:helix-turn-helix domain-containing protein [Shinella sp. AETb1-6]|uniref:XRE family transcriptional regulator n=1 Tax=Shinella sumterensis TaxID=1967501 RepID=A0AA50CQE0_9HYPH|nr:XRE family transcriptional regulator [Shinella sumterensis]MXN52888.1 helix-turn-helix domain-containing protein [Shinella sp. AETb1-6]WLR99546.1 XRE family transcriptional regulator [Shinella sumterensis]